MPVATVMCPLGAPMLKLALAGRCHGAGPRNVFLALSALLYKILVNPLQKEYCGSGRCAEKDSQNGCLLRQKKVKAIAVCSKVDRLIFMPP